MLLRFEGSKFPMTSLNFGGGGGSRYSYLKSTTHFLTHSWERGVRIYSRSGDNLDFLYPSPHHQVELVHHNFSHTRSTCVETKKLKSPSLITDAVELLFYNSR